MRGADSYRESLFSTIRLEDFVSPNHPLRAIRIWMNDTLARMDERFSAMYEADIRGGHPSIAPDKLMRAMLLQLLFSIRSERQLVEQINYNLLFRWFVGLSIDDAVWNHSVFSKNRDRLIKHEAVTELFNATVNMAEQRGLLSGEHFSVDGTLIKAWASHKSMRRKDGSDDGSPPEDWRGEPRSNETHELNTDDKSRLYRKRNAVPALPSYLGHVLSDNRHGLVVNVRASQANGLAEREVSVQMLADVASKSRRKTMSADNAYDTNASLRRAANSTSRRISRRTATGWAAAPSLGTRRGTRATHHEHARPKAHRAVLRLGEDGGASGAGDGAGTGQG